jgi:hypothetical protein
MTTIITKNGSGAPTAGQLSEGELAVDLTNKELYTKSGSTVIKIGSQGGSTGTFTDLTATSSFTSPGIDDNANATAITIDASENVAIGTGTVLYPSADRTALTVNGTSSANLVFGHGGVPKHYLLSDAAGLTIGSDGNARLTIDATGNVGYSGKLFSSNAPATLGGLQLYRNHANGECFLFDTTAAPYSGPLIFGTSNAERMRITSAGNVGIGTAAPAAAIHVAETASGLTARFSNETNQTLDIGTVSGSGAAGSVYLDNANSGNMQFRIGGSEKVRIDASGNLGIGTGSGTVLAPLHVDGSSATGVAGYLRLQNETGNTGYTGVYFSADPTYAKQAIYARRESPNGVGPLIFAVDSSTDAADVAISDEKMRLDASGNLGIGTSAPAYALHVNAGANNVAASIDTTAAFSLLAFDNSGAGASPPSIGSNNDDFRIATAGSERMRINASGVLQVGTTSQYSGALRGVFGVQSGGTACEMHNSGGGAWTAIRFHTASTLAGYISVATNTTGYNTSSDERLKKNVVDAPAGNIDSIKVRSFDWKADGEHQEYGFIAQELETVAPYAISKGETDEDMWGVDYSKLVPMMIKEIQDLKAEVAALKGA